MTKIDIITEIQEQILANDLYFSLDEKVLTKHLIQSMLELFLDICKETVASGEAVELRGFGTFVRKTLKARKLKLPGSDDIVETAKRARPVFKPSISFKNQVNDYFTE